VNEAQRFRQLEEENRRLKHLVADLSLDKEVLKAVISKKRVELAAQRQDIGFAMETFGMSERRACGAVRSVAIELPLPAEAGPQR
jgi:putative transposase